MKIKWNDDRVRDTATALLLISRDRLRRGATNDLIALSLADYRRDPAGYKANKAVWAPVTENGPLTIPRDVEYYAKLRASVGRLLEKMVQGKRQFNSLSELDNFLSFTLEGPR